MIGSKVLASGLILVPFMISGSLAGKKVVDHISEFPFVIVIDVTLLLAGTNFLFTK